MAKEKLHPKRVANKNAKRPKAQKKELDELVKAAWTAGWWCERRSGQNYILCYPPDGARMVSVKSTPSKIHTVNSTARQFRRAGLDV